MTKLKISTRLRSGIKDVEGDAILKKLHSVNSLTIVILVKMIVEVLYYP